MTTKDIIQKKIHQKHAQPKYELVSPEGGWGFIIAISMSIMFVSS